MSSEDEDVVLVGSALHTHLVTSGYNGNMEVKCGQDGRSQADELNDDDDNKIAEEENTNYAQQMLTKNWMDIHKRFQQLISFIMPDTHNHQLEIELAEIFLESDLLVVEDEEFFRRFIISDVAFGSHKYEGYTSLLLYGGLAAIGGVLFCSQKRSLAATAIPLAFASVIGLQTVDKLMRRRRTSKIKNLVRSMLRSMKQFKIVLNKSINLIRGMEMINKGFLFAVQSRQEDPGAGPSTTLSKALCKRTLFLPLRQSVHSHTVQTIWTLRQVVAVIWQLGYC